jgi:hypothetical protein
MTVLAVLAIWGAAGFGAAFAFEVCYPVWISGRRSALSKDALARAYWSALCVMALLAATPLAPLAFIPVAVSHTDLTKTTPESITVSAVFRHIPEAIRRLLRNIRH